MHPKGTFCPAGGRPGEHPPGRKVLRSGCAVLHLAAKVERVWKSNQSRNAPKVEGASPAWKSNDFARKNLRQSQIGFVLCTFVSWFRYIPRIFDHFTWRFVSSGGFVRWDNYSCSGVFFWWWPLAASFIPPYFLPFVFGFPAFLGLPLPLPGISALVLGFTMAFKRIARFFAWL